jgi:Icc-related predicted phosphoesterase
MTKLLFVTDVHGSERCWKKLVNSGKFYGVDLVVLGGDMTGKGVITLVDHGDGAYKADFQGRNWSVKSKEEIEELERYIRTNGFYPCRVGQNQLRDMQDSPEYAAKMFENCMVETLKSWLEYADQRLEGTDLCIYVAPGNDDEFVIDSLFEKSNRVVNSEGKVIDIDGEHEMLSTGYSNPTPWKTPREEPEENLKARIEKMIPRVKNMPAAVFAIHVPPHGTGLDEAPVLDENLKPQQAGMSRAPVGSTAVRELITRHQPLLGLHGHIHESKGAQKLGRTLCVNPGSEYADGTLLG